MDAERRLVFWYSNCSQSIDETMGLSNEFDFLKDASLQDFPAGNLRKMNRQRSPSVLDVAQSQRKFVSFFSDNAATAFLSVCGYTIAA